MTSVSSTASATAAAAAQAVISGTGSQISKANETQYDQSNLLGTWSGAWSTNKQAFTVKVDKITGATANIEYTHNGTTQKLQATVSQNTISFGDITLGTKNGTQGAAELVSGSFTSTASLKKTAPAATTATPSNNLVGSWSGLTSTGNAASFTVTSITGSSASVTYTINGITNKGTGTYNAKNNVITYGSAQIALTPEGTANVVFKSLGSTYSVPVKKASTTTKSTSTTSTFA
jgi:hypothetical protein